MIIVDDVHQVIDRINKITDPTVRTQVASAAVWVAIASTVYYILLATVVLVLGRRIINATSKAWKESRREY